MTAALAIITDDRDRIDLIKRTVAKGTTDDEFSLFLHACKRKDWDTAAKIRASYIPLEDARDAYSPIRVLHEAIRLAGIADTGPLLPLLSNIEPERHEEIRKAASALLAADALVSRGL